MDLSVSAVLVPGPCPMRWRTWTTEEAAMFMSQGGAVLLQKLVVSGGVFPKAHPVEDCSPPQALCHCSHPVLMMLASGPQRAALQPAMPCPLGGLLAWLLACHNTAQASWCSADLLSPFWEQPASWPLSCLAPWLAGFPGGSHSPYKYVHSYLARSIPQLRPDCLCDSHLPHSFTVCLSEETGCYRAGEG